MDEKTKRIYRLVAWVSGLTAMAVIAYGVFSTILSKGGVVEVGSSLVNVEFPFTFFAKPISYFTIASVAFFYSSLKIWEERIATWPRATISTLRLLGFVIAFASAYEVMYNFMLWGSFFTLELISQGINNPDFITGPGPIPWNLVFATKVFSALFVISGYSVYFLRRLNKEESF